MSDDTPIRLLIVDDQAVVRQGLAALLGQIEGMAVVGEAGDGREAIAQARELRPDVILMDLAMPHLDGVEAIRQILARQPDVRILVLTSFAADDMLFPALRAGALGYLLKDIDAEDLVKSIRQVHQGEPSLHPQIARRVLREVSHPAPHAPQPEQLTERELEVLQLVATGHTNQEIADKLTIAEVTARTHVSNILSKLRLANRVQATLYALREGLVELPGATGDDDPPPAPPLP